MDCRPARRALVRPQPDRVRIYLQGDSNVTSGGAAALLQNDTTMISIANRVIAIGYITLSFPCRGQKAESSCLVGLLPSASGNSVATVSPRAMRLLAAKRAKD